MKQVTLGGDKYATEDNGAVLIVHGQNNVNLRRIEAEKLKRWLDEVI